MENIEMASARPSASDINLPFAAHPDSVQLDPRDIESILTPPPRVVSCPLPPRMRLTNLRYTHIAHPSSSTKIPVGWILL
jgi:hypothetical protein